MKTERKPQPRPSPDDIFRAALNIKAKPPGTKNGKKTTKKRNR